MFKIIHLNAAMIDIEILTCTCIGLHVDCQTCSPILIALAKTNTSL